MPPVSTSKRSACDRCRNMKLRCPPRECEDSTLPCGRCLRLGAHCVSSFPRLIYQPPKHNARTMSMFSGSDSPGPRSRPNQSSNRRSSAPMDLTFSPGDWSGAGTTRVLNRGQGQGDLLVTPSSTSTSLSSTIPENIMSIFDSSNHKPLFGGLNVFGASYPEDSSRSTYANAADILALHTLPILKTPGVESDHRLSSLRISLAKQAHRCQSISTIETLDSPDTSSNYNSEDMNIDQAHAMEPQIFGDALRNISSFLSIIEGYAQELCPTADRHNNSTRPPVISIVIYLDILSAYVQLVAVYDDLCSQLYNKLRTYSQSSFLDLQVLPGLQLAGVSIENGYLQTKIMIQVVIHHFEMIEKVLGLPMLYRISGRLDTYTGLLEDDRGKRLLRIVMEDKCGNKTLKSLRENLKKLQRFIHM